MPMPITARRLEARQQPNLVQHVFRGLRKQRRTLAALRHDHRNEEDRERCRANPPQAWRVYRERQQRLRLRTQEWTDDLDRAARISDEALRNETIRVQTLNVLAETEFVVELCLEGFDICDPNINLAKTGNEVEASDRKTRFGGKVRPFLGERLEGEHLKARPRSKKRKLGKPYPSSASTPPAKRARRAEPSPSSPDTVERRRRSALGSPEETRPAPPAPAPAPAPAPVPADTIPDAAPLDYPPRTNLRLIFRQPDAAASNNSPVDRLSDAAPLERLDHQPGTKLELICRQPDAAPSNNNPAPHTVDSAPAIASELLARPERLKPIAEALPASEPPAPIVWNANFDWAQPAGTGLGDADEQRDPNPIYEVKRIKFHVKAPVKKE
ncbi:MAG: hypothetical protein Q9226_006719 [Calogaya cf. arnoldii]